MEGTDRSLIQVLPQQTPAKAEKDHETPVMLAGVQAEITALLLGQLAWTVLS